MKFINNCDGSVFFAGMNGGGIFLIFCSAGVLVGSEFEIDGQTVSKYWERAGKREKE